MHVARAWPAVAEVVPLKQGLKLYRDIRTASMSHRVAEVVPLKQGLKRMTSIYPTSSLPSSCRGSSIKTRIETQKR